MYKLVIRNRYTNMKGKKNHSLTIIGIGVHENYIKGKPYMLHYYMLQYKIIFLIITRDVKKWNKIFTKTYLADRNVVSPASTAFSLC